ncbi:MAG: hypothetical protein CFE45_35020 [Burkholderiales bacterium PBB5]|nr:MAG: hypothetical protein CFE45_35020 [Burkholderiales bacterium PBB5]
MRHYPTNSPQAASRIVALALLADGHLTKAELDVLDQLEAHTQLGLDRSELHRVAHAFCEAVLATTVGGWANAGRLDAHTLNALLAELDDPALRERVLLLCTAVVDADRHVTDGESQLLLSALAQWGLLDDLMAPPQSLSD